MSTSHTTRTGLFPTVVNKEESQPKSTVKQKVKTAAKVKAEKTPVVGILKRKSEVTADKRRSAPATLTPSSGRHVKFRSKATDQESLREKLNSWLVTKGKTPSRCRHLMCFNAEVSAKKRKSQEKLVDRTITQNLLSDQFKVLKNEEQNTEAKKELFEDAPSSAKKPRRSMEKENRKTRRSIRFDDTPDVSDKNLKRESGCASKSPVLQGEPQSPMPDMIKAAATSGSDWNNEQVLRHLNSMLQECLTLYDAGCPLDNLLPWLADIETHVPKALTFAPYYICKAKVLSAFPHQVLDVFVQAVRNNAQPRELLAQEMKASLSLLLIPPPLELPPVSPSHRIGEESLSAPMTEYNRTWSCSPSPICSASRRPYTPSQRSFSMNCSGSRLGDTSNSLGRLSDMGSYGDSPCTEADGNNSTFSVLSVSAVSSRVSSPLSSSRCSTPLDLLSRSNGNVSLRGNSGVQQKQTPANQNLSTHLVSKSETKKMGSTVKYAIGSATPLLKNVAEASPAVAVITPVRRSTRLSGRQLTPGTSLRREIISVSDLSETERQTMLFQTNPAITGN